MAQVIPDREADVLFAVFIEQNFDKCDPLQASISMDTLCGLFIAWIFKHDPLQRVVGLSRFAKVVERHGLTVNLVRSTETMCQEDDCDLPNDDQDDMSDMIVLGLTPKKQNV